MSPPSPLTADDPVLTLGRALRTRGYRFTTVTPSTHARILHRDSTGNDLRAIFGWNRWFDEAALDPALRELLVASDGLESSDGLFRSKLRFATVGELLLVHSAYPTNDRDAVFFGPDSYRFVRLIKAAIEDFPRSEPLTIFDIGCGTGVGGIFAAQALKPARSGLVLCDINDKALRFSAINSKLNDLPEAITVLSDVLAGVQGTADLILCNPPYLVDAEQRVYRDGGGELGISLSSRIVQEALPRLAPGGRLILYTGTPIIDGSDLFFETIQPVLRSSNYTFRYEEIDPDVFGEELEKPAYRTAERIAVVALIVTQGGRPGAR